MTLSARKRFGLMPAVASARGIKLYFYYNELHGPHVHIVVGGRTVQMRFNGTIMNGYLPPATHKHVRRWLKDPHVQRMLVANWNLARESKPLVQFDIPERIR